MFKIINQGIGIYHFYYNCNIWLSTKYNVKYYREKFLPAEESASAASPLC